MEEIKTCPICNGDRFSSFLQCKDATVTQETFKLVKCACGLVITNPRPTQSEIGRYYDSQNYISHTNGTASLFDTVYRLARNYTLHQKLQLINKYASGRTILDYGCGTGTFINKMSRNGWKTIGVEPSRQARVQASNITAPIHESIAAVSTNRFAVITLWHVLEHVHDLNSTLANLANLLEPNGLLILAVPNINSRDAKHYQANWAAYDVPRHLWHFTPATITRLLANHHLKLLTIQGMPLDAYYVSILSQQNISLTSSPPINYLRGLWQGFRSNLFSSSKNKSSLTYIFTK